MKKVKCKSGIIGWQCRLRENYENDFGSFQAYSEMWGIAKRLGFDSAEQAWKKNPTIQGSVLPDDLRVVKDKSWRVIAGKEYKLHSEEGTIFKARSIQTILEDKKFEVRFIPRGKYVSGCFVYKRKLKKGEC